MTNQTTAGGREKDDICPDCKCCELIWKDCYNCDEFGFSYHDCEEDTCCCLAPENNVICEFCKGNRGWYVCPDEDCNYRISPAHKGEDLEVGL